MKSKLNVNSSSQSEIWSFHCFQFSSHKFLKQPFLSFQIYMKIYHFPCYSPIFAFIFQPNLTVVNRLNLYKSYMHGCVDYSD